MPRMFRFEAPGSIVHIMSRGIEGRPVFCDDGDRHAFLTRLSQLLIRTAHSCLAWCLMGNHYHLVLRSSENSLSSLMRPLNGGYARWFNRKYDRRGYLFQDRFKSILCQDQLYARELIRYVHLNPIRAGLVHSLEELKGWPWCGHGYVLGEAGASGSEFQERFETLRRFGESPQAGICGYTAFLAEGIDSERLAQAGALSQSQAFEAAGAQKGWPAVIGGPEFARGAMERHAVASHRLHRQADYGHALAQIAGQVCLCCGITRAELFAQGRGNRRSRARALFCLQAHQHHLLPLAVVARFLKVTIPAVNKMVIRAKTDPLGEKS